MNPAKSRSALRLSALSRLRRALRCPSAPLRSLANRFAVGAVCIFHFSFSIFHSAAQPPTLDALFPPGAPAGATTVLTVTGKTDPWPGKAWCSNPKVTLAPDKDKKATFKITVPADTQPGPVLIRLHNAEGASAPRIFLIGKGPEHNEDPKHSHSLQNPEPLGSLPITVNGRLAASNDVDIFRISLKSGQTLVASVDGYGLRSGIDPYLHLYDPDRVQVALGNDNGRNLDPLLRHLIEKTGDHLVAVMAYETPPGSDVQFTGSSKNVYRLNLTTDPNALPKFPPDSKIPKPLAPPFNLNATIAAPNETDRYTFTARKSESYLIEVTAQGFGSPLDPVLILEDAKAKVLRTVDDTGKNTRDAEYLLKIPADGDYSILVFDRFRKGTPGHHYRISVTEAAPSFKATADKSAYLLEPGKSVDLKLKLTRLHGHATALKIDIPGLPKGVTFKQPEISGKTKDVTLKLEAAKDAPAANLPLKISLVETEGDKPASQAAIFSFQDDNARGPYLIDEIETIWLTVTNSKK